jgi:hypothetical protein
MGLGKYIKTAFLNRWNLLAFAGGIAAAAISGSGFLVVAPLVLAAEVAYLGLLGTHPKFQKYVDRITSEGDRQEKAETSQQTLKQILRTLPGAALARFEKLRAQCLDLRQIAADLAQSRENAAAPLDSLQVASFDKLLWMFLRLLFTEYSLTKFLEKTNPRLMQQEIGTVEERLKKAASDQTAHGEKMRRTLEDNLKTSQDRLANYQKAKANHELVQLELDRLENKIKSLAELSVNRQEPDFISAQVDAVAGSMLETEKTMNELQFVTGLAPQDEEVPDLVQNQQVMILR